jgi:hypothetical protein
VFSPSQIALSALVGVAVSTAVILLHARLVKSRVAWGIGSSSFALAVVVGLSILLWRLAGNTPALNEDPIAFVSPNDVLCPAITYVALGVYGGAAGSAGPEWLRLRAWLTLVSLIVNVVTI